MTGNRGSVKAAKGLRRKAALAQPAARLANRADAL
jgi:hypothetical protein